VTFARGGVPSVDEIRRDLRRFNFFAQYVGNPGEGDIYVDTHARRFHAPRLSARYGRYCIFDSRSGQK